MKGEHSAMPDAAVAHYHLPGLFEFYDFYRAFLPLYRRHREYFYDWCDIASLYGAPEGCLWGGGRIGSGNCDPRDVLALTREYGISARLTFSNSLLRPEHLADRGCNRLCRLFAGSAGPQNGVIVHSELLLEHLRSAYPELYLVSSTTKVLTDFSALRQELERPEFRCVVPDFRLNRAFDRLDTLPQALRDKVEFLCNECCDFGCRERRGPPLRIPGRRRRLSLFPGHGESRLHRGGRHPEHVSAQGLFPIQDRGPEPGQRSAAGVSAALSDPAPIPHSCPGGPVSGQWAGPVLTAKNTPLCRSTREYQPVQIIIPYPR